MRVGKKFHIIANLIVFLAIPVGLNGTEASPAFSPAQSDSVSIPLGPALRQIIGEIDRRRLPLRSLSAQMKVRLTRQNGESNNLDASYIGDDQGNLRLRLTGPFGILALDLALHNGRISCWMPLQKRAVSGSRAEILADGTSELALLVSIGNASDMFFPRPWIDGAMLRRANLSGEQLVIRAFDIGEKNCLANYIINPAQRAVSSQQIFNRSGRALGLAEYPEFCAVSTLLDSKSPATQFDAAQLFPRKIRFADAGGRLSLDIVVEKIALNPQLAEKSFALKLPSDLVVSDIGEMLAAGKELFSK